MKYNLKFSEELDRGAKVNVSLEVEVPLETTAHEVFYEDSLDEAMFPVGFAIREALNGRLRVARLKASGGIK